MHSFHLSSYLNDVPSQALRLVDLNLNSICSSLTDIVVLTMSGLCIQEWAELSLACSVDLVT